MSEPAELVPFVAESVEDAVRQVRARLGPTAVVVEVRRVPVRGRGWFRRRRQRFEILAYKPAPGGGLDLVSDTPAVPADIDSTPSPQESPCEVAESPPAQPPPQTSSSWGQPPGSETGEEPPSAQGSLAGGGAWRVAPLLESSGLLPAAAQRVVDELRRRHGDDPPPHLQDELRLTRKVLAGFWPGLKAESGGSLHVLVGPFGSGKTTCLCKWLTQIVLGESRRARVWRLSAQTANTAEHLEVYCEILGIKVGRSWPVDPRLEPDEIGFVDLPGVNWRDGRAVRTLAAQLERLGRPRVHLVVNGAYENSLLLRQAQALAPLGVEDLLVTHLDEEARWGRIWNLVLGTNCGIRFLSAGQNVPGDFLAGSPEALLGRQFPV